jgi:signal transduction histidine kinase
MGLFWLVGSLFAAAQEQENHVRETACIEDATGEMNFTEVLQIAPKPYSGFLTCGYSPSTWWVRITLDSATSRPELALRIRPQFLDEIALFDPLHPTAPPIFAGDRHAPRSGEFSSLAHTFTVPQPDVDGRQYWLRIRSTSSILLEVKAYTLNDLESVDRKAEFFYDLYIGFLACSILWSAAITLSLRDPITGAFMAMQICQLSQFMLLFGYGRFWLPGWAASGALDRVTNLCVVSMTSAGIIFYYLFMRAHQARPWALRLLLGVLALYPLELLWIFTGHARLALHVNMTCVLLMGLMTFIASLGIPARIHLQHPLQCFPRRVIVAVFALMFTLLIVLLQSFLIPYWSGNSALYGLGIHGFISGLVMWGLLHWRALYAERLHSRKTYQASLLRRQLHSQRVKNEEQQQFVSMLAHELKTPLSVLRLSLASDAPSPHMREFADQAILDMAGIIDRCAKAVEIESEQSVVQIAPCDLRAELDKLRSRFADPQRLVITAADFPDFQTDSGLFQVIVGNLVDNALKYADPTQPITLDFVQEERGGQRGLALAIANVPGMAGLPDPKKIFENYYRSPGAHRLVGAGLGLFLVRGCSKLLGGGVACLATPERVTFRLWLPY